MREDIEKKILDFISDLNYGEEDGKIVTRDSRNARIVCWDKQWDWRI